MPSYSLEGYGMSKIRPSCRNRVKTPPNRLTNVTPYRGLWSGYILTRLLTVVAALVIAVCLSMNATAQSTYATASGFVQDPSQAFIPGVTVTATNTQTGLVAMTISNESGTYTIVSLLPGTYRLTAELPGTTTSSSSGSGSRFVQPC